MDANLPNSSKSSTTSKHTVNPSQAASSSEGPSQSVTAPTEVIDSPVRVDIDAVQPHMQSLSGLSQDVIHIGSWASLEHLPDTILPQEIPHSVTRSPPARLRLPSDTEEDRQSGHAVGINAASREGDTRKKHGIGLLRSAMQRGN